jgi:ATP-dependent RNA helicase RhlE
MGFIAPIRRIAAALPASRQTLLFSATMPREIEKLAASLLRNPVRVAVTPVASAAPRIEQRVHAVSRNDKPALLVHLLKDGAVERAIVFVRTKHGADRLCRRLAQQGLAAQAIHGNRNQNQRQRSLDAFRGGKASVLVATDVAARGIDIDGVTHVFNFDLPNEPEAYVHRIGRTGRAGAAGVAIAFCDPEERALLRGIERLLGAGIPSAQPVRPDALRTEAAGQHADAGRASTPHHGHAPARRAPVPHPAQRAAQARKAEAVRSPGASRTRLDHEGGPKAATRPGLVSGARRRGAGHGHRARGAGVHPAHSRG